MISEAFQWAKKKPANPTNVVEEVNSDRVRLVWDFVLDQDATIGSIQIQREGPGNNLQIIATKGAFLWENPNPAFLDPKTDFAFLYLNPKMD